jgi:hypothetical protein
MKELRERKCGCIYYAFGPPLPCPKHAKKSRIKEEKALRRAVEEQLAENGHVLTSWSEYDSLPGKWTSYCENCGVMAIVYDLPQHDTDQVNSWGFKRKCGKGATVSGQEK